MNCRSFVKALSFCIIGFAISCEKSDAPSAGGSPTEASPVVTDNSTTSPNSSDEGKNSTSADTASGDDEKKPADTNADPNSNPDGEQSGPLSDAKQSEIKGLFAGTWTSACIKFENPDVAGQFFSSKETWKVAADGSVETTYHDFDDGECKTPSQGFESYVVGVANPVGVKELGSKHFYVEMNITKELDENGVLSAATGKYLIMVKFDADGMSVDYFDDLTATALSADAIKFTKK